MCMRMISRMGDRAVSRGWPQRDKARSRDERAWAARACPRAAHRCSRPSPLSSPNACGADAYSVFAAVPQAASAPSAPPMRRTCGGSAQCDLLTCNPLHSRFMRGRSCGGAASPSAVNYRCSPLAMLSPECCDISIFPVQMHHRVTMSAGVPGASARMTLRQTEGDTRTCALHQH